MKPEELSILVQLIESLEMAVKKLEDSLNSGDGEKTKKIKEEILSFQREIAKIIK